MQYPRLKSVDKYKPPYPINQFPSDFAYRLGREIVYHLASRNSARLEGSDWEQTFAAIIGAEWKPSNVGLDDVVLEQTAWGAKTVKHTNPSGVKRVRLISGRNSPVYSFGDTSVAEVEPQELGSKVLSIWNERVASIRRYYRHARTVVLIKSPDLLELAVFEFETVIYPEENYEWVWNGRGNLQGFEKVTGLHLFTWQPHGSQFTIVENVPEERLALKVRKPIELDKETILRTIGFNNSWIEVLKG